MADVQTLKDICDAAYKAHPGSCSHAVWYVIKALVDPDKAYEQANALIDTLSKTWTEVDLATAGKLANQGEVVVGGLKASQNGHVIVVYPGPAKKRGGYKAMVKDKKTGEKTEITVAETGLYPLAMSTSLGSWPGAMSKGDKTVWDPWGVDATFKTVKFWHHDTGAAKATTARAETARATLNDQNGDSPSVLGPIAKFFF